MVSNFFITRASVSFYVVLRDNCLNPLIDHAATAYFKEETTKTNIRLGMWIFLEGLINTFAGAACFYIVVYKGFKRFGGAIALPSLCVPKDMIPAYPTHLIFLLYIIHYFFFSRRIYNSLSLI